ncbi:MAG: hypothetical protein QOF01_4346 [Thermomicrobiales bacterium]|nr:hypothetical protein [Thermomicrobiales bacterium]
MTEKLEDPSSTPNTFRRSCTFLRRYGLALWVVALPLLTIAVVLRRQDELQQIASAIREANPMWLVGGLAVEALILIAIALTYRSVLRRLGHSLSCPTLLVAHLQRTAIGAISPLSGPTSVYVFLRYVKRRRVGTDDGLLAIALRSIVAQAAFLLMLVVALGATGSAYALPIFVVLALAVVIPSRFVVRRTGNGSEVDRPCWTARLPRWARERTESFVVRARRHRLAPTDLALPLVFAIATRLGAFGLLYAGLHALNTPASVGVVATAYCAGMIAYLAIPIFQGAGAVEAAAAMALTHGGVPAEAAIGAVLLWRLLEFWLPIALGLLLQVGSFASSWTGTRGYGRVRGRVTLRPAAPAWHPGPAQPAPRPLPATATAAVHSRVPQAVRRQRQGYR